MLRLLLVSIVVLSSSVFSCSYDYAQLSGSDAGSERPATSGSGGGAQASGGQIGTGSGGGGMPATGGTGGGNVTGTGGAASGSGGSSNGSGGAITGSGGRGTGGGGGAVRQQILSIDFIGGYTVTVSSGGSSGSGGQTGAGGSAGTTGQVGGAAGGDAGGAGGTAGGAGSTGTGGAGSGGSSGSTTMLVSLPKMAATEVAGVMPAARWNGASGNTGTLAGLTLADGTVTSAAVTWNAAKSGSSPGIWRIGYTDAAGDVRMMNGYLDPLAPSTPGTVTVADLPASITTAGYDVYVYVSGHVPSGTRTYRYTIGAVTTTVSQGSPSPTTFTGYVLAPEAGSGNYIVFRNVSGASFTLTATPGTGSPTRAPVNGVQIVSPAGS